MYKTSGSSHHHWLLALMLMLNAFVVQGASAFAFPSLDKSELYQQALYQDQAPEAESFDDDLHAGFKLIPAPLACSSGLIAELSPAYASAARYQRPRGPPVTSS